MKLKLELKPIQYFFIIIFNDSHLLKSTKGEQLTGVFKQFKVVIKSHSKQDSISIK